MVMVFAPGYERFTPSWGKGGGREEKTKRWGTVMLVHGCKGIALVPLHQHVRVWDRLDEKYGVYFIFKKKKKKKKKPNKQKGRPHHHRADVSRGGLVPS